MSGHPERILGIAKHKLSHLHGAYAGHPFGLAQGFIDHPTGIAAILEHAEFRVRDDVEEDPSFKQIIPYVMFLDATDAGRPVFTYLRGKGGVESRLHAKRSLGVGGHIEEKDMIGGINLEGYVSALEREIDEEISIGHPLSMNAVGMINDDTNPVGSVHFGIWHLFAMNGKDIASKEEHALTDPIWIPTVNLPLAFDQFETWSQIVIRNLRGHDPL
jgi:predicted NUDIX family phosphoesterase